jgi:hypothetical protein
MEEILQHKQIQDTIYEKSTQQTIGLKKSFIQVVLSRETGIFTG